MADMKEKLVELIEQAYFCNIESLADHLIAHGVTVQGDKDINVPTKWISVKDRLPEHGNVVLVHGTRGGIYTAEFRLYSDFGGEYPH